MAHIFITAEKESYERNEFSRSHHLKRPGLSGRQVLRRAADADAMIWLAPLAGFGVSTAEAVEEAVGKFRKHPRWKFLFVDHCTTNPWFVPRRVRHGGRLCAVGLYLSMDRIREVNRHRHI
jgi:hypothetical protein